jgi:hypothetical protein
MIERLGCYEPRKRNSVAFVGSTGVSHEDSRIVVAPRDFYEGEGFYA